MLVLFYGYVPQCDSVTPNYFPIYDLRPGESALLSHLRYREIYPEEPPLVVLSAMPTPEFTPITHTVMPTQAFVPVMTPDAYQVEHWQEYQTELAKALFVYNPEFPQWSYGSDVSKDAICEWDILGWSDQEMYLWVACISANGLSLRTNPAVVYLELDDSIQKVNVPNVEVNHRDQTETYDLQLFPIGIQEKLCLYYFYGFVPQCHEITPAYIPSFDLRREGVFLSHLKYRKTHPEEPPLIALSVLPTASLTP
jgi:hypothetical protein